MSKEQNERTYLVFSKQNGEMIGDFWYDASGVYAETPDGTFERCFESLDDAFVSTGACRIERVAVYLPIPGEMLQHEAGIAGLNRAEAALYLLLKNSGDFVKTEVAMDVLCENVGVARTRDALYQTIQRLRKKMPHNQSIEGSRGKGYRLVVE